MGVRIGTGISTHADPRVGAIEAAQAAGAGLDGAPADLVVLFASGGHMESPESTLEGVHEALRPSALIGCNTGGVLGCGGHRAEASFPMTWGCSTCWETSTSGARKDRLFIDPTAVEVRVMI